MSDSLVFKLRRAFCRETPLRKYSNLLKIEGMAIESEFFTFDQGRISSDKKNQIFSLFFHRPFPFQQKVNKKVKITNYGTRNRLDAKAGPN